MLCRFGNWAVQHCLKAAAPPNEKCKIIACMRSVLSFTFPVTDNLVQGVELLNSPPTAMDATFCKRCLIVKKTFIWPSFLSLLGVMLVNMLVTFGEQGIAGFFILFSC